MSETDQIRSDTYPNVMTGATQTTLRASDSVSSVRESAEVEQVRKRYARRRQLGEDERYSPFAPENVMTTQERDRAIIRWINSCRIAPVNNKRVLEIGAGSGSNLLHLIQLGFRPENLVANELIEERADLARTRLPAAVAVVTGDACDLDYPDESFDVVYQSTVFTSILDRDFQSRLADKMWRLTRRGGGVLWYDFTFDNPNNPDVRGIPLTRIRELFPDAGITAWRITLAPPISRRVARIHPALYTLLNALPFLRTHLLCWIARP